MDYAVAGFKATEIRIYGSKRWYNEEFHLVVGAVVER
jgi:hypothetical protein